MLLEAIPDSWFSWNFTVTDGRRPIADIDVSWWREKGVITVDASEYRVYRERVLGGAFVLERSGSVLARAEKPSFVSRRLIIECNGVKYTLRPRHILSRAFLLVGDSGVMGALSPRGLFSRRMQFDLPGDLALPVRVFIVWLTIILWKRDSDAAAGGS